MEKKKRIIVTGAAGFVGYHVTRTFSQQGHEVIGIDNLNDYYDVRLKQARLSDLLTLENFRFHNFGLTDVDAVHSLFRDTRPTHVINLAAQVGVRYSLENPGSYINSNVAGFLAVLEACRAYPVEHLVYASTSAVYGANPKLPFSVEDSVDHPMSLYAATKKSNELMAHSYSHLFEIPTTGLRFFTVYGPWGRPDMAIYSFTRCIDLGKPIQLFDDGRLQRDFTYIDDIVAGITAVTLNPAQPKPKWRSHPKVAESFAPYRIYNIGNENAVEVRYVVRLLEQALGKEAKIINAPRPLADVEATFADISSLREATGFSPKTSIEEGIQRFIAWYRTTGHKYG